MRTATIAEAKEQLEELIAAARAGERVEIVDEGEVPVTLVLSDYAGLTPEEVELLDRLESAGLLVRGALPPDPFAVEDLPNGSSGTVKAPRNPRMPSPETLAKHGITGEAELLLQALLDEREENW